jgi:hypothetical protein
MDSWLVQFPLSLWELDTNKMHSQILMKNRPICCSSKAASHQFRAASQQNPIPKLCIPLAMTAPLWTFKFQRATLNLLELLLSELLQ